MKCKYCGMEITPGSKFCNGCGAPLDQSVMQQEYNNTQNYGNLNMPYNQYQGNMQMNGNMPTNGKPKDNKTKILIIALIVVVVIAVALITWFVISGNDSDSKNNDNETSENNNVNNDNNGSSGNETLSTVEFGDYTLSIPDGYTYYTQSGNEFIKGNNCLIMYMEYPLNTSQILSVKDTFIEQLKEQGIDINSFETQNINGIDFIVAEGKQNGYDYSLLFADLSDGTPIFLTVAANNLGKIDKSWYNDAAKFVASASKTNY